MSRVEDIVATVENRSPGLLEDISREDGLTKEELVRKVLALSRGKMVCTHQGLEETHSPVRQEAT